MGIFSFIDSVSEVKKNESLTAFFTLSGNEEFLKDHFTGFPVMPGVLQLELLRQAASRFLCESSGGRTFFRFQKIGSVKYGQFVKPGNALKVFVRLIKKENQVSHWEGRIDFADGQKPVGRTILADFTLVQAQ